MEGINTNRLGNPENKSEKLSGKGKLEAILALFGTEAARKAFLENCRDYTEVRDRANLESFAPDPFTRRKAISSNPGRSDLHNRIMETLTRLASQAPIISPLQSEILREMHNREFTAKIIKEYLASKYTVTINEEDEDEEDKNEKDKGGMSDTAYYHFLSKGG